MAEASPQGTQSSHRNLPLGRNRVISSFFRKILQRISLGKRSHSDKSPNSSPLDRQNNLPNDRRAVFQIAANHSRRVKRLRFWLPIASLLIVVGFLAFSWVARSGSGLLIAVALLSQGGLTMDNPKLNGFVDGRAYRVEAKQAYQNLDNPDVIDLENITAVIDMQDGLVANFSAGHGRFDTKSEKLVLDQTIIIQSNQGHGGRLERAEIDLKSGSLVTNKPISMSLPDGQVEAGTAQVMNDGKHIIFGGGVKFTILPIGTTGQ